MSTKFDALCKELTALIDEWEPLLCSLPEVVRRGKRNKQNRTIKQIIGHMVDSATNNTHRIIHMQYQSSPVQYPDYANLGNNDRWIAIQNYQAKDWSQLIRLWDTCNRHIVHVIQQVDEEKLKQVWTTALGEEVTLEEMIVDFPRHFKLHLEEIEELLETK